MNTAIFSTIWEQISQYIIELDWSYIFTFIIIAYGINQLNVKRKIKSILHITTPTRYRTAITGVLYGIMLYFLRGDHPADIECLFRSLIFAMVFHKLIIDTCVTYIFRTDKEQVAPQGLTDQNPKANE